MNRIGFVETSRAIQLGTDGSPAPYFENDWSAFNVIDTDQRLSHLAVSLAVRHRLKSLDAIHLASALVLPAENLAFATWDRQLHRAARAEGLEVLPGDDPGPDQGRFGSKR